MLNTCYVMTSLNFCIKNLSNSEREVTTDNGYAHFSHCSAISRLSRPNASRDWAVVWHRDRADPPLHPPQMSGRSSHGWPRDSVREGSTHNGYAHLGHFSPISRPISPLTHMRGEIGL